MDTIDILSKEFFTQDFAEEQPYSELLGKYKDIARNYARMESAVAVLSDMRTNMSYIYYGSFSRMLEIDKCGDEGKVSSIWEKKSSSSFILTIWQGSTYKNCVFSILSNTSPRANALIII